MEFKFMFVNRRYHTENAAVKIPVGNPAQGLVLRGAKPWKIVLTKDELLYLLQNPDYTLNEIINSMCATELPYKETAENLNETITNNSHQ